VDGIIWKEAKGAQFEALFWHSPGASEDNQIYSKVSIVHPMKRATQSS